MPDLFPLKGQPTIEACLRKDLKGAFQRDLAVADLAVPEPQFRLEVGDGVRGCQNHGVRQPGFFQPTAGVCARRRGELGYLGEIQLAAQAAKSDSIVAILAGSAHDLVERPVWTPESAEAEFHTLIHAGKHRAFSPEPGTGPC